MEQMNFLFIFSFSMFISFFTTTICIGIFTYIINKIKKEREEDFEEKEKDFDDLIKSA